MTIRHSFMCEECDTVREFGVDTVTLPDPIKECVCGGNMFITYVTPPNAGQSSAVDNYFNGGVFDEGAGQVFHSRKEQQAWMDSRGLELAEDMTVEEFAEGGPAEGKKLEVKDDDVLAAMGRAKQKISEGWKPPTEEELLNRRSR